MEPSPISKPSVLPSLKATLGRAESGVATGARVPISSTLVGVGPSSLALAPIDLDETLFADARVVSDVGTSTVDAASGRRTTVLPRRRKADATTALVERARFDRVRVLGEGANGEVELARDNDIRRTVAVKRIKDDVDSMAAVLRFADEVRIVGQLEHPGIVPIYDVGRDESGKIYLVMKHLQGETMEQIIESLRAGDPEALAKYTLSHRVHLFLGILDAIRYAHARGIVHRDLKPANIMIGPYGEVTVLDWGIAKPFTRADKANPVASLDRTAVDSQDARLLETQFGSLAGTPIYMSPEQAAGLNDEIDDRSDVYSLCVVLYEWLTLEHPLAKKRTVPEVLAAIISKDYTPEELNEPAFKASLPMEYLHLCTAGLQRDRSKRFQSAAELEQEIKQIQAGRVHVSCHVTLAKRAAHGALRFIDRHPLAYTAMFALVVLGTLGALFFGIYTVIAGLSG